MSHTAQKLIQLYSNINALPEDKISEIFQFVQKMKTKNEKKQAQRVGQLAGLCKVSLPDNLEVEIRKARKEISTLISSKKI